MVKEKDEIDDLISQAEMELSDSDVDKLISEAEAESPKPQKPGYFSGINQAMDEKAMEYAQKNLQPEKYPLQHAVQKFNSIVDIPLSGLSKAVQPITQNPTVKKVAGAFGEAALEMADNPLSILRDAGIKGATLGNIAKGVSKANEKYPALGEVGQLAGSVVGVGGAGKLGSGMIGSLEKPLKNTGLKIQNVTAKISKPGAREGAKIETIAKNDIWGNATKIQEKSLGLIKQKAGELKNAIDKIGDTPDTQTNLYDIVNQSASDVLSNTTYDRDKIRNIYQKVIDDYNDRFGSKTANLDLVNTQLLKRETGKLGDWVEFNGKRAGNKEASIEAQVYNDIYDKLKTSIEEKGPPEIKKLNKELSELIPLERDMAKRSLVEKRNEIIPLKEYIGTVAALGSGHPATMGLVALQQATKSPTIGRMTYGLGKGIETLKNTNISLPKLTKGTK